MTPTEVDKLRRTARLMRERALAAGKPWRPWSDDNLPERTTMPEWSDDMCGYLGGSWGDHAAAWTPAVALIIAKWLDVIAEGNGLDLTYHADESRALELCDAYLREGE